MIYEKLGDTGPINSSTGIILELVCLFFAGVELEVSCASVRIVLCVVVVVHLLATVIPAHSSTSNSNYENYSVHLSVPKNMVLWSVAGMAQ